MSPTRLPELELFVAVVDQGSFTAAAAELSVSKSHVSKVVRALEDRLGTRLLHRTTRSLSPTPPGLTLYERGRALLEELDELECVVSEHGALPVGRVRATAPTDLAGPLGPLLAGFAARHPQLELEVSFTNRTVDLVAEGYDLAVRVGHLAPSTLVARRLARAERVLLASPDYVAGRGALAHPDQLLDHELLCYTLQVEGRSWPLRGPGGEEVRVRADGRFHADHGAALAAAAAAGLGVALLPDFVACAEVRAGRLVRVLPAWSDPTAVWAVTPTSGTLRSALRALLDHLVEALGPEPPWAL